MSANDSRSAAPGPLLAPTVIRDRLFVNDERQKPCGSLCGDTICFECRPGERKLSKDDVRNEMRQACAIAHGCGSGMSLLELGVLVLEHGLPPREERERMLAAKLAEEEGDTAPSSPELLVRCVNASDASAER